MESSSTNSYCYLNFKPQSKVDLMAEKHNCFEVFEASSLEAERWFLR